jgi:thiamine kinase-like enzyme
MATGMETREQTPPHYPTHGVHLSDDEIEEITRICLPAASHSYAVARLQHGKSFNNRIYFVNDAIDSGKSYVLKVNGKFFGPAKIENEVACLWILKRFCPAVPVPEVVAWSTNGCQVVLAGSETQGSGTETTTVNTKCRQGWIFMTCLPGEAMNPTTLTKEDMSNLSLQVAQIIVSWRSDVPKSDRCGNLRSRTEHSTTNFPSWERDGVSIDLGFDVEGILDIGLSRTNEPMESALSYWKAKLCEAIDQLSTVDTYASNRDPLLPRLERFNKETIADLSIFQSDEEEKHVFIFSHTDLSPRNVLITGSPPQISGIVDFEFSGFFPYMRDFTGKSIVSEEEDEEGWPIGMHTQILLHLEGNGLETPLRLRGSNEWTELMNLVTLETYIAPWWLGTDITDPEELSKELRDARSKVEDALAALTKDV